MVKVKGSAPIVQLPKDAINRVNLGQSFAEYDLVLQNPNIFVETPAFRAALNTSRAKCFFIGRRGTGKTAITLLLERQLPKKTILILPQLFSAMERFIPDDEINVHERPFKTLVSSFKRAIMDEVASHLGKQGVLKWRQNSNPELTRERNFIDNFGFDLRLMDFVETGFEYLAKNQDREWFRFVDRSKKIAEDLDFEIGTSEKPIAVLIDRIDESWDGSDKSVILLMALMHASIELSATVKSFRPLIFLRENVFERVRMMDAEFSRLETFVVSLDWTKELLRELVERRLQANLITKPALGGPTWDAFFEPVEGRSSQDYVFDYCQYRPRDILTFCGFAIESAQSRLHRQVMIEDLQIARKKFSDSRLKDLADEYGDNYPQLSLVLELFYGLGDRFTVQAIEEYIAQLLTNDSVKTRCNRWIYRFAQPALFIGLLYQIGFFGIQNKEGETLFRSVGPQSNPAPKVTSDSIVIIHPTYADALQLQNRTVTTLANVVTLKSEGLIEEIPASIGREDYYRAVQTLQEELLTLPSGDGAASRFEEIVLEIVRLCFFKALSNVEHKRRNHDGRVIRDVIASNNATVGFWEMIQQRYRATQIIWECKNYDSISADDFHQAAYYMSEAIGSFVIIVHRGNEITKAHVGHVARIAQEKKGMILILGDRDLQIFLRHAQNNKANEPHLRALYDGMVRDVS
jgi:hypothetical protein